MIPTPPPADPTHPACSCSVSNLVDSSDMILQQRAAEVRGYCGSHYIIRPYIPIPLDPEYNTLQAGSAITPYVMSPFQEFRVPLLITRHIATATSDTVGIVERLKAQTATWQLPGAPGTRVQVFPNRLIVLYCSGHCPLVDVKSLEHKTSCIVHEQ